MTATVSELMSNDGQQAGPDGPEALRRRQRRKNIALAAVLAAFAILVYFVAIVRMGAGS
jgi:hypothetical protein